MNRKSACQCGSGKQYGKCCYQDDAALGKLIGEIHQLKDQYAHIKTCSVPSHLEVECHGQYVKAHSISRSHLLQIAENGHVLGYRYRSEDFLRTRSYKLERVGVRDASTFFGFCEYHDKNLFTCLEDVAFSASPKQCFFSAYRALSKEVYEGARHNRISADLAPGLAELITPRSGLAIKKTKDFLGSLGVALKAADFSKVATLVVAFRQPLPVQFSIAFAPRHDFRGPLNLSNTQVSDFICMSTLPYRRGTAVLLSWEAKNDSVGASLAAQISEMGTETRTTETLKLAIHGGENHFFSPSWVRQLGERGATYLRDLAHQGAGPLFFRPASNPISFAFAGDAEVFTI